MATATFDCADGIVREEGEREKLGKKGIARERERVTMGEVGEVQNPLNQKLGSKPLRAVDFASRFVIIIESTNF
jgi:hypothetical protein